MKQMPRAIVQRSIGLRADRRRSDAGTFAARVLVLVPRGRSRVFPVRRRVGRIACALATGVRGSSGGRRRRDARHRIALLVVASSGSRGGRGRTRFYFVCTCSCERVQTSEREMPFRRLVGAGV